MREHAASGTPNDIICGPEDATNPPGRGAANRVSPSFLISTSEHEVPSSSDDT